MFYYMKFRIGVCIPSTCDHNDMDSISAALSSSLRLNITIPDCRVRQLQPLTTQQLVGGLLFGLVVGAVLCATIVDCLRKKWEHIERQELEVICSSRFESVPEKSHQRIAWSFSGPQVSSLMLNDEASSKTCYRPAPGRRKLHFGERLRRHWSWMSFSLLTNFKLHFRQPSSGPDASSLHQQHPGTPIITTTTTTTTTTTATTTATSTATARQEADPLDRTMVIRCLNGIRVLSLCWVIVANSYVTLDPRATKRLVKTREAPRDFLFQLIVQASLAIETFFFLSGLLTSLGFARRLQAVRASADDDERTGPRARRQRLLRWVHFYVHRYVRMTPATMLVIAFSMYAYRYGDGPLWFEATQRSHQSCSRNWWRHLLHVANFIDTRQMCFIHYWYIAADMQLFLLAPFLMLLLHHRRRLGHALMVLVGLASIGSVFYTTYAHNLPPTLLFYSSDPE